MNAQPLKWIAQPLRAFGPYLFVELLLPGGTLIALAMWLSQRALLERKTARDPEKHAGGFWWRALLRRSVPAPLQRSQDQSKG